MQTELANKVYGLNLSLNYYQAAGSTSEANISFKAKR